MKLGIVVNNVGQNQPAFMAINRANGLLQNTEHDIYLFYKEVSQFFVKFAGMSTSLDRMYHFEGPVIATDFDTASFLCNTYAPSVRVLYLFNLDWLNDSKNYLENIRLLTNKELVIIAPSEEYAKELYNYCGRQPNAIIPRFNLNKIIEVINNEIRSRESS